MDVIHTTELIHQEFNNSNLEPNSDMGIKKPTSKTKKPNISTKKKPSKNDDMTVDEIETKLDILETKIVEENETSDEDVSEDVVEDTMSPEEREKFEFRLSDNGVQVIDDYIKLLESYKEDLKIYQTKEEDSIINTLRAVMNQKEIEA